MQIRPFSVIRQLSLLIAWGTASIVLTPRAAHAEVVQVFTSRTAWEDAMAGRSIQMESFNDFSGFTYRVGGAPAFKLPVGTMDVGLLRFEVDRPSGNLIVGGNFYDTVDGTTFWRVEAATENSSTPPLSPAILFSQDTFGFGADWNFFFTPRSTMTFGGNTMRFRDYLGIGISFLGFTTSSAFDRVEFDVESPFNTLFHADNVSFAQVPEPSSLSICLVAFGLGVVVLSFSFSRNSSEGNESG